MDILLISARPEAWAACEPVFRAGGGVLTRVSSPEEALSRLRVLPPRLVILDPEPETDIRKTIIDILMLDANVHTAVVSAMTEDAFHEAMEGLGILMSLPSSPTAADAERLLAALARMP